MIVLGGCLWTPPAVAARGLALGDIDPGIYQLTLSIREEGSAVAVQQTRLIQVAD